MFQLMFSVPCLYVLMRWLAPLPVGWPVKLAAAVAMLVLSQYHQWNRLSSGSIFDPEFPRGIVILFNWGFGALALLFVGQVLLDVGALATAAARREWVAIPLAARLGTGATAGLLAAIGVWNAVRVPAVHDVRVAVRDLPAGMEGYRLVQLTDLHLSRLFPRDWAKAVIARTNAAGADAIVITGDFIDGAVAMRRADVAPLAGLRAPGGVWGIPGNHEYFFDYDAWMAHLRGLGIRMLPNAHGVLERGGGRLVLAGVTDLSAPRHGRPGPDLAAALAGAPAEVPIVLLDHQPRDAARAARRGVALQLSGHTHGGMIVGLDRLVARANGGFVSRGYRVGDMTLYVSNGTGLWPGFALRLGRPGEITRFTLTRAR